MNWDAAEQIANAVLYEGYLLYPYRASALKNSRRWMLGVLYPPGFCLRERGGDRSRSRTECLLEGGDGERLAIKVRFLQALGESASERAIVMDDLSLGSLRARAVRRTFHFSPLQVALEVSARPLADGLFKVSLTIDNESGFGEGGREEALSASLLSCHALLGVRDGGFVSPTDPPPAWAAHAEQCANEGTWPALVGDPSRRNLMLSSPVILPDYPAVAPESPGDFFDGTEIDELLSLRIRVLADKEKDEIRGADDRARRLLNRTEAMSDDELLALHGTWRRQRRPRFQRGQRVRLRPARQADIFDLELRGKTATIVAVEVDLEGRPYVAVTVDDDPGNDLGLSGHPGHRFFFGPEELEPL